MRTVEQTTNNKFINIKEVTDPDIYVKGYQFAERRGINSVAFICYDEHKPSQYLLNHEVTPPLGNVYLNRAFGGSFDKNKTAVEIVKDEVREEVGYDVPLSRIIFINKMFVSTQMNQFCELFAVNISGLDQIERKPENKVEALSSPIWLTKKEILNGEDWKSICIITRLNGEL